VANETNITAHNYQKTRVEPTSTKDGSVTYTCACGDSYQEVLYATGSLGLEYEANDDGTYTVAGIGTCTDSHVLIPSYYNGTEVTRIATRAFYNCSSFTEITIPATVRNIGTQIFYKCSNIHTVYYNGTYGNEDNPFLKAVNIKKVVFCGMYIPNSILKDATNIKEVVIANGVTSIASSAFSGCSGLISITIPDSVTSIGGYAFSDCSSLTSINIPDSVTSIGYRAFYDCSSLTSINIPDSITSIEDYAFSNCRSLTSITIPDSVTSIGSSAFSNCWSLTSINIPDSITSIEYHAFSNCRSLTSIAIPDSVTSIDSSAFYDCNSLKEIRFSGTKEQWNAIEKKGFWGSAINDLVIFCTNTERGE
jgi:hypothetical protein